jgi:capsular polysaccharide biosynthesis protein
MYGDISYGLFAFPSAFVRGAAGFIFTKQGAPLWEQNAGFLRKGSFLPPRLHDVHKQSEPCVTIDEVVSLRASCHSYFWHWMMDSLPKVFLAEEAGFCGHYLVPPLSSAPWASQSLEALGIHSDRILNQDLQEVHARLLYVPTYFCGYNALFNSEFIKRYRAWIHSKVCQVGTAEPTRLFIGRRETSKFRRILNQSAVEHVVEEFGFRTVYFEDLSFQAQVRLAHSADAIMGGHGSGLSHTLFMQERSVVVELFPYERIKSCDCYEMIAQLLQHRYRALESCELRDGDVVVDIEQLRAVLVSAL